MKSSKGICWSRRFPRWVALAIVMIQLSLAPRAFAGGPRFVTGANLAVPAGQAEGWATTNLQYFTDPGSLASTVTHAQADAMVAAAAAVWNVPTSSLTLGQGGELAEHVSGANSYFDGQTFVFPADVLASNEAAVPVPILYDTDGSLTDLLLGSGASEPTECRQNAVTQSVDDLQTDGHIHHALVVLNGRCVGSAPEQMVQMQYQLARAFGRVLGLAWSQTNDNVFTAEALVTADQVTYWPIMHPLDVFCAAYTYQCMLNPFTLRPDDLSALAMLYPVLANHVPTGKQASDTDANFLYTVASFPTGQGMGWLNFTATRQHYGITDGYQLVSGMSGEFYQQSLSSPVTGIAPPSGGTTAGYYEGYVSMRVVPVEGYSNIILRSEPINVLYTGEFSVGPYAHVPSAPSGSAQGWTAYSLTPLPDVPLGSPTTAWDAASTCRPGNDGSEGAPAPLDASGWQSGQLCGWGHNSWWSATLRAGRSWTLEATATDETGAATTSKAEPVLGIWNAGDATGTLPTVASAAVPFNALALGMTKVQIAAATSDTSVRFVVGDAYGAGRPDFTYTARLLYADVVSPASVGAGGGTITITGTGFRPGNVVEVNGVVAVVKSWTATQIVAIAPAAAVAGMPPGTPADVTVADLSTGGTTTISAALSYTTAPDLLQIVSAPSGLETGVTAAVPLVVRVTASDGITPLAGATVQFDFTSGSASLGLCSTGLTCQATTDPNGIVQTTLTGVVQGNVSLVATEVVGGAQVTLTLISIEPARSVSFAPATVYVAAGASDTWTLQLDTLQDGAPISGVPATWTADPGLTLLSTMATNGITGTVKTGTGRTDVSSAAVPAGSTFAVTGCAWGTNCATWTLVGVDPSQIQLGVIGSAGQSVVQDVNLGPVGLLVTDLTGHPVQDATVLVHQRVLGWEGPCANTGRCPSAPVLVSSETTEHSRADGSILVSPLQVDGVPQTVEMAFSYGTQGLLTLTLVKVPN